MKPTSLILLVLLFLSVAAVAQTKTIINPAYEISASGIRNVVQIELTDTATLLTIHDTFVPHWWDQFDSTEVIRDSDTKKGFIVKGIRGAELGKYLWMPDSGDSTIVLVFPPLPATVKKIDYDNFVFGLSLDPNQSGLRKPATVSPAIDKWMNEQL
jgi:hypothetical protein